jgi:hypothetical protein
MKKTKRIGCCLLVTLALGTGAALASDPIGIYARVERVVLEPGPDAPERIQVWGTFVLAVRSDPNTYGAPESGYMYFKLQPGKEDVCRREWADLKRVAGQRQVIGFGSRWDGKGRVRKASEKPTSPDVHPVSIGMTKLRTDTAYAPVKALLESNP